MASPSGVILFEATIRQLFLSPQLPGVIYCEATRVPDRQVAIEVKAGRRGEHAYGGGVLFIYERGKQRNEAGCRWAR